MRCQRLDQGGPSGSVAQSTDAQPSPSQAIPKRRLHFAKMSYQARRACQHQQERRLIAHPLTGVEQNPARFDLQGVRFIHQHRQGLPAAPGDQSRFQVCDFVWLRKFDRADVRNAQPSPSQPVHSHGWSHGANQPVRRRDTARNQLQHVYFRLMAAALSLEPVQKYRLAIAARPDQNNIVGRGLASLQIRQTPPQNPLLFLAPGKCRRDHTCARSENALFHCPNVHQMLQSLPHHAQSQSPRFEEQRRQAASDAGRPGTPRRGLATTACPVAETPRSNPRRVPPCRLQRATPRRRTDRRGPGVQVDDTRVAPERHALGHQGVGRVEHGHGFHPAPGARQRDGPVVVSVNYSKDATLRHNQFCSANTNSVFPLLGRSSGVRRLKAPEVSDRPVLTATYCFPSTA